jgi:hypothetical protein
VNYVWVVVGGRNDDRGQLLELNQSVLELAEQFLERSSLPAKADVDAVHIAAATVHGMDYLLT